MEKDAKIVVFGGSGLIGSEITNLLRDKGYKNVIACTHKILDLENQEAVEKYIEEIKPNYIFFCAVRTITDFENVGCIDAVEMYSNIMMQLNVMESARKHNVNKAVFLGSAMLYPWNNEHEDESLKETYLEDFRINQYRDTMKSTVLSKFVSMKMCQYYYKQYGCKYIYAIPTHIYGNFNGRKNLYFLENLVKDLCEAKKTNRKSIKLDIFGEGKAQKQILHVKDCADAIILTMEKYEEYTSPINIATDKPESWSTVVEIICNIINYNGEITFNIERKENMMNRICSIEKLYEMGWRPQISMYEGLRSLCNEYMQL